MISYVPTILAALNEIESVTVSYHYPDDFNHFPHISFYELSNVEADYDQVTYQIDVWSLAPSINQEIALKINEKLHGLGFKRAFSGDLFENDSKIHHKTMRYEGYFHNTQNRFYKEASN